MECVAKLNVFIFGKVSKKTVASKKERPVRITKYENVFGLHLNRDACAWSF